MLQRLLVVAALLVAPLAHAQYEAGKDYHVIEPPQATSTGPEKIEVVEVFGYPCIHCAHAAPIIAEWAPGLGKDVQLIYMPAIFGGVWEAFGRAFYTAETMGVMEKTHEMLFQVIHTEHRQFSNLDEIAGWYAEHGVNKDEFLATMQSFAVNAKIASSQEKVRGYGVEGTPTMIVNGKYRVMAPGGENSFQTMLKVVDFLIAKEREAKKAG